MASATQQVAVVGQPANNRETYMPTTPINISSNDLRKALPDAAWNAQEDSFFTVWAAAPGMESSNFDYFISGQKISNSVPQRWQAMAVAVTAAKHVGQKSWPQ